MNSFAHNSWHVRSIILILSFASFSAIAQIGGKNSFDFINVPNNSRLAALGGVNVSLADRDVNFFSGNPALTGDSLAGFASASYQFYVADIGHAFISYAHPFSKIGTVTFGIQHMNYRTMQGYDPSGIETAEFNSGETALMIGKSHQLSNFRLGVSVKGVFSTIAGYRATGVMADIGGLFLHPNRQFSIGLAIKNIGFILSEYTSNSDSHLPFDVQAGLTLKPEHMPLRFSITTFNLTSPDATYYNSGTNEEKPGSLKKIMSHVNVGTEILIHKNVNIMVGYNYLVHEALKLTSGGGGAGISVGFSAAIKSVEFIASRNAYVAGNAGYSFTLSSNVTNLLKRR